MCQIIQKMLIFSFFLTSFLFLETGGFTSFKKRNMHALRHANNHFAVAFHKSYSDNYFGGNIVFSPFSIFSSLSMLYFSTRGETAEELREVLGYGNFDDVTVMYDYIFYSFEKVDPNIYTVSSVSAMVVDKSFPIVQRHKETLGDVFEAYVQEDDVAENSTAVVDRINTWAKIKTRGAIADLADAIDPETKLYLASAAYFKGAWKVVFDPEDTKYHPFYNGGQRNNASEVLMMHAYSTFRYYEGEDEDSFTAVELFYEGRNMSMVIYLPNKFDGLEAVERNLTEPMMYSVRGQMYYTKVHLTLPKFKLESRTSLCRPLQHLGVRKIFRGSESDFSGMVAEDTALALTDVKHKALIEVNEKGSVAAAVTRAVMTKSLPLRRPDPEFKVNHPFLFAIFDTRNSLIMFMGRVTHF